MDSEIAYLVPSSTAFRYRVKGAAGTLAFIWLMSTGVLRACLLRGGEVPLREKLRAGVADEELLDLFVKVANLKPIEHRGPYNAVAVKRP